MIRFLFYTAALANALMSLAFEMTNSNALHLLGAILFVSDAVLLAVFWAFTKP